MKKNIIIDCDPGADDALGLLLALRSKELNILGITTSYGNCEVEQAANNATKILKVLGKENVKVYVGEKGPLRGQFKADNLYCGEDGLCNINLEADIMKISSMPAYEFIIKTLVESEERVIIISTTNLSNIAKVIKIKPEVMNKIEEIYSISGFFSQTKGIDRQEWNALLDVDATKILYSSGVKIKAFGLDVTSKLKEEYALKLIKDEKSEIFDFVRQCMNYNETHSLMKSSILVDAMAIMALIKKDIAVYVKGFANVEEMKKKKDMIRFLPDESGNIYACIEYDFEKYIKELKERLK